MPTAIRLLLCLSLGVLVALGGAAPCAAATAAPAPLLNCQGRLTTGTTPATGVHTFAFSILAADATVLWSSSGISVTVSDGLYAVTLGDTAISGMTAIPASILNQSALTLQITADGQVLAPNIAIVPSLQASMAFSVAPGAIGTAQLQAGAVGLAQLDPSVTAALTPPPTKLRVITSWTGAMTIAAGDVNGSIVALCGAQSRTSPPVTITFPTAASVSAGSIVRLRFQSTTTSAPAVSYILQSTDMLTLDAGIYQALAGSAALTASTNVLPQSIAFASDGVSSWYQVP